jgi:hypothetical protein
VFTTEPGPNYIVHVAPLLMSAPCVTIYLSLFGQLHYNVLEENDIDKEVPLNKALGNTEAGDGMCIY